MSLQRTGCAFRRLVLGVAIAFVAAAASVVAVQGQGPPQQTKPEAQNPQQPTFRAGANLVRVDVYPMLKGAPVRDLTKQDFRGVRGRRAPGHRQLRARRRAAGRRVGRRAGGAELAARGQRPGGRPPQPRVRDLPGHVSRARGRLAQHPQAAHRPDGPRARARRPRRRHDARDAGDRPHPGAQDRRHQARADRELDLGPARRDDEARPGRGAVRGLLQARPGGHRPAVARRRGDDRATAREADARRDQRSGDLLELDSGGAEVHPGGQRRVAAVSVRTRRGCCRSARRCRRRWASARTGT